MAQLNTTCWPPSKKSEWTTELTVIPALPRRQGSKSSIRVKTGASQGLGTLVDTDSIITDYSGGALFSTRPMIPAFTFTRIQRARPL
jgi:hypothetical protein